MPSTIRVRAGVRYALSKMRAGQDQVLWVRVRGLGRIASFGLALQC